MPKYKVITTESTTYEYNIIAENEDKVWEILHEYQSKGYGIELDHDCYIESIDEETE